MKEYNLIAISMILLGVLMLLGNHLNSENTKFSVVGFIGFIPFGFANDKKLLILSLFLVLILLFMQTKKFIF